MTFATTTLPDVASFIGSSIVASSVVKSGNAAHGFRTIKRLQNVLDNETINLLHNGLFDQIHKFSLTVIEGGFLDKMATENSTNGQEPGDIPMFNNQPILLIELLHLILMCITDLYITASNELKAPPFQPCIDMCILAENAFRVQMNIVTKPVPTPEVNEKPNRERRVPRINKWHCLMDVFLSKIAQSLPYFQFILQYSESYVVSNSWVSAPGTSDQPLKDAQATGDPDFLFTPALMSSVWFKLLFRVKRLIVLEGGFPNPWVRSTALDLLLAASSATYAPLGNGRETATTNDWRGADTGNVASDEDEVSIEGLTDNDNPDVLKDFRDFLASSGQQ